MSMREEGGEPRLYVLLNALPTLSRTRSSCHHTDVVLEMCGWVTKSSVQLPRQFYLEHYATSRSVELGYLSFTIFTIMDFSSKVTFIQAILFIRATLQWLTFRLSCNSEHLISPCPHPCVHFVIKHYIITSSWDEQESQDCRTPYT